MNRTASILNLSAASLLLLLLLGSSAAAPANELEPSRLAGLFVKDSNENGQLRFLAGGLNSNTALNGNSGNNGLNAAINQYINNKQDALEQLRPTNTNAGTGTGTGTGLGLNLGTLTGGGTGLGSGLFTSGGTGNGAISTTSNGAIYVSLNNAGNVATNTATSNNNQAISQAALNQAIYGSSPIANLLPAIVGNAVSGNTATRRRPSINRRGPQRRRVVNNRISPAQRRRKNNKGKGGKKPQVVVVRPNRG